MWAKTVAHEGTSTEHIDQRALGHSCTWGRPAGGSPSDARIYAAENKHGLYLSDDSRDSDAGQVRDKLTQDRLLAPT